MYFLGGKALTLKGGIDVSGSEEPFHASSTVFLSPSYSSIQLFRPHLEQIDKFWLQEKFLLIMG